MNLQPGLLVVLALALAVGGAMIGIALQLARTRKAVGQGRAAADAIIAQAKTEAEGARKAAALEAKEEWHQRKEEFERETLNLRRQAQKVERRLAERETGLDRRSELLDHREKDLVHTESRLQARSSELDAQRKKQDEFVEEQRRVLERISGLTAQEAKQELVRRIEDEARLEIARKIKDMKDAAVRNADRDAQKIITMAIARLASEVSSEVTVSVVPLPNDEMKGRIIGREGRNIRAFEQMTGIDVIIDDTPEAVVLSCFDPVRREIARISLERLISDGRIHPTRIEEVVNKAQREVQQSIREAGEKACLDLGITGVHDAVVNTLGRLRYRTSYGQNILHHSMDVAYLCGMMAAELGLDTNVARRSGLFHDIGKAVDHEVEGPHAEIGENLLRKFGESELVSQAVGAHHNSSEMMPSLYPVLVQAADAISGARPGARRETLSTYIKRLEKLEGIAREFPHVAQAYAIQAGREIRVMVDSNRSDDAQATQLSIEVARKIEQEMDYPGTIKVVVIRETRSVEYAK